MKIFLILFMSITAMAQNNWVYNVDLSSTNMATTFPTGPQLVGPPNYFAVVQIRNYSNFQFEVNCAQNTKPSSASSSSVYIDPYTTWQSPITPLIQLPLAKTCWFRSVGSTANAGNFEAVGWGY